MLDQQWSPPISAGAPFPRRTFLRRGAATALALWLAGLGLPLRRALASPVPSLPLRALDRREYAIMRAIARRILDDDEQTDLDRVADLVALRIDRELQYWEPESLSEFKRVLWLFEDWTLVLGGMWGEFTGMSPADQDRYLAGWMASGLDLKRQAFITFKTMVAFFHYTLDETWGRIGYDGTWVKSPPMVLE